MSLLRHYLPAAVLCIATASSAVAQHIAPPTAQRLGRTASESTAPSVSASSAKSRPALQSVPTEQYSHGDPTPQEQVILELINRARATPREEGVRLIMSNDAGVRGAFDYFNVDTGLVRAQFATYPSRPPLAFNAKLISAARRHMNDMRLNNFQDHRGTDGSAFDQRIREAGYTSYTSVGENIAAYAHNLWYSHVGFNVDWGNPDLGHRHNIMNFDADDAIYTEFGAGVHVMSTNPPQGQVGPVIVVHEFARNSDGPFLLGVVYYDSNENGFYDIGEGLGGVRVMPSAGRYYAFTSTSGGYAIPVETAGSSFTVTFSGGPLASSYTRSVTVTGDNNVKLDLAPTSAPGLVPLVRPLPASIVTSRTVNFTWRRPGSNVDRYHLLVATDSLMTSLIVNDSTLTDTTTARAGFISDQRYFWQVRAHNSAAWGEFGASQSFRVLEAPAAPVLIIPTANGRVLRTDVRFIWTRPAGPVVAYELELAFDRAMSNSVVRDTAVGDTTYLIPSIGLATYYWRVRAKNEAGWGAYSEVRQLEGVTSGVEGAATDVAIERLEISQLFPNPVFEGNTVVAHVQVPHPTRLRLEVVDALGRVIADLTGSMLVTEMAAGEYAVPIRCDELPQGFYFVRATTSDGESATTPLKVILQTR